jgi:hypothetical protein
MAFEYDSVRTDMRIGTDAAYSAGVTCRPPVEWVSL